MMACDVSPVAMFFLFGLFGILWVVVGVFVFLGVLVSYKITRGIKLGVGRVTK